MNGKSFIQIQVKTVGMDSALNSILKLQSAVVRKRALQAGAIEANDEIRKHYQSKGRSLWVNNALPTHGAGRKLTQWWRHVETGWAVKSVVGTRSTIENDTIGLSHKVTGGTIRAKRKKFLTIPIDPRAHGLRAKDFQRNIAPLFRVKNILAMQESDGRVKGIYALKKSVTQAPWPNALPPEQGYTAAFVDGVTQVLMDEIEKA